MRVPPSKCPDEAGDNENDDDEEEDKKLPGKLDDNDDER
jgi:hypothetical protein